MEKAMQKTGGYRGTHVKWKAAIFNLLSHNQLSPDHKSPLDIMYENYNVFAVPLP